MTKNIFMLILDHLAMVWITGKYLPKSYKFRLITGQFFNKDQEKSKYRQQRDTFANNNRRV